MRAFIEKTQVPFLRSPMGKGVMPDDHPLSVAAARTLALQNADVVFLMGARFNWIFHFGQPPRYAPDVKVIQLDIAPEEIGHNKATDVALVGDAVHPMTPDLTQGACQAIIDGTTLAACLAACRDPRAALQEYQQRRWRNAAATTLITRTAGAIGQWKGRITCTARDAVMRATPLSLQLRQLDAILGRGSPADSAEHPEQQSGGPAGD